MKKNIFKLVSLVLLCGTVSSLYSAWSDNRSYNSEYQPYSTQDSPWVTPYYYNSNTYDADYYYNYNYPQSGYSYNRWEAPRSSRSYYYNAYPENRYYYYYQDMTPNRGNYRYDNNYRGNYRYDNDSFRNQRYTARTARRLTMNDTGTTSSSVWNQSTDEEIVQQAQDALRKDPTLAKVINNIQVTSNNGKVTLQGKVNNGEERNKASADVRNIPGVKTIENQIEVVSRATDY